MKKAMEQSVWIVVTIIVCLIAALILAIMVNSTANKTKDSTEGPITEGGNALKIEMCKRACDSCGRVQGGVCDGWNEDVGKGCQDIGVDCPYE